MLSTLFDGIARHGPKGIYFKRRTEQVDFKQTAPASAGHRWKPTAGIYAIFPRLRERRRQLAGSLAGGEQQMLAIGRGVMADPRVLLIDELSLGLMPLAIDECYRVLHRLAADGIAILLVEQNTERVLKAAGHIAVLETGKITWTGTGSMAMANSAIVNAYLGADYR